MEEGRLVRNEILAGTGVDTANFWSGFETTLRDLAPKNRALLERRDELQAQIDAWHLERKGQVLNAVRDDLVGNA